MEAEKIEEGDVVYLKSGGPKMSVYEIPDDNNASCSWFDKNKDVKFTTFSLKTLTKEDPN